MEESADVLRAGLVAFLQHVDQAVAVNPFVDRQAAHEIAERLTRILDLWPQLDAVTRARVAEVVAYVVDSDDEEHDLLSPIGLVDDEERITALERALGL
jgi:hypothetical protein